MRIPIPLAWFLLIATCATAALLRTFHERTPEAPVISPIVGSALFAAIFLLLLVTARERRQADVLNGIAYDEEKGLFLLTGKYWPKMFEVVFR